MRRQSPPGSRRIALPCHHTTEGGITSRQRLLAQIRSPHHTSYGSSARKVIASVRYISDRSAYDTLLVVPSTALRSPSARFLQSVQDTLSCRSRTSTCCIYIKCTTVMAHLPLLMFNHSAQGQSNAYRKQSTLCSTYKSSTLSSDLVDYRRKHGRWGRQVMS